ncbi:MAG: drug/metabolite transporter (DMT)-like permease [Candidatus Woesearchaeota archaeon]|jgi:drug/metabolite transporter (DMT)-like permease
MWFIFAIVAVILFSIHALLIRSKMQELRSHTVMWVVFLVVGICSTLALLIKSTLSTTPALPLTGIGIIFIILAGIASYFANISGIAAIQKSPNPGLTSAIISSKAILTIILGFILFETAFSSKKVLGCILIIGSIFFIQKNYQKNKRSWITFAFIAAPLYGIMEIFIKYSLLNSLTPLWALCILSWTIVVLGITKIIRTREYTHSTNIFLLSSGVITFFGNILAFMAYDLVANPGYISSILAIQTLIIGVSSKALLKLPFTKKDILSVCIVIAGVFFLVV